jgi:hypothetical protein
MKSSVIAGVARDNTAYTDVTLRIDLQVFFDNVDFPAKP